MERHQQENHPHIEQERPNTAPHDMASDQTTQLQEDLVQCKESLASANDKYLRLCAEFDNFRKRVNHEKLTLIETAGENILQRILPIVDDFERALYSLNQQNVSIETTKKGIIFIHDKMTHLLEQSGATSMQLKKGDIFNPELQEAISKIPAPDASLKGKIVDVVEQGYVLKHKVLRYAKVIIGE